MLAAALGWIPIIGPILQGLFNTASAIYGKFKDTQLGMRTADVQEAQISEQIIRDTNDSIGLRILRDIYCTPACIHLLLVSWDTILADPKQTHVSHSWIWHTADYPPSYSWYTTSVAVFLLGNIGMNLWKRK